MENLDLQEIRKKLDGIDNQLVELFEKRMAVSYTHLTLPTICSV